MAEALYISNDNLLRVSGLRDDSTGAYINTATVTVTLKDSGGSPVSGQAWPLTLAHVTGTNGRYQGTLEETLVLVADTEYTAEIDAVLVDLKAHWEFSLEAKVRT